MTNLLLITCHDLGQHLGCYGIDTVQSPNLDRLAAQGVRFENFYSTSAVCSPARGSLHTGRYPQSNGLMGLTHAPWWWEINDDERHTAQLLSDAGYETYLIGFNHIDPDDPDRLGYEHVLSQDRKADETVEATGQLIREAATREASTRPFFAKVGFTEVHRRFTHGEDTTKGVFMPPWLQDTPAIRQDLAAFQATIKYLDDRVGEILDALAADEIADETLVVFTSDHGIPYAGAKASVRKAGIEIPLILYQPGTLFSGGKVVPEVMSNVDVLPTLLDYLGVEIPENVQGHSFLPFLVGDAPEPPRDAAFAQYTVEFRRNNTSRCIITDRYHLIRYFDAGRVIDYPIDIVPQAYAAHEQRPATEWRPRPFVQLFDLQADPYELNDIGQAPENAELVQALSRRLLDWMQAVDDPLLDGPIATPYYRRAIADLRAVAE